MAVDGTPDGHLSCHSCFNLGQMALSCLPVPQVFLLLLSIHSKMSLNFMIARWSTDTRVAVQWKSRFENQLYAVLITWSWNQSNPSSCIVWLVLGDWICPVLFHIVSTGASSSYICCWQESLLRPEKRSWNKESVDYCEWWKWSRKGQWRERW